MTSVSITSEEQLDDVLSTPSPSDIALMDRLEGDILVLGVSGKMGPSLARLAKRASGGSERRVIGVARFSDPTVKDRLESWGIETHTADLLDRTAVDALPSAANVVFMAGQKFGTSGNQALTWAINAHTAALAAEKFRDSRIVAFSTGNVYPLSAVAGGGPDEESAPGPIGEYAQSALGRERLFEHFSTRNGTPISIVRLNYAIDLRYGVLRDIGDKVFRGQAVDLAMGHANVIWQRDANSIALRMLERCDSPPFVLNVTGAETLAVRSLAERFAGHFGVEAKLVGTENATALLSNAAKCVETFGEPETSVDEMIAMVADWVRRDGASLGKPTHFEEREGGF